MKSTLLNTSIAIISIAISGLFMPTLAQNTFKCGSEYSDKPCPGGTAVPAADARSAAQKSQADSATKRDAKMANELEKDRIKAEAAADRGSIAAVPAGTPAPALAASAPTTSHAKKKKKKEPDYFTAATAGEAKAKPKKSAKKSAKTS